MKQSFVGIDVSKNSIDVHVLFEDVSYSFAGQKSMMEKKEEQRQELF